MRVATFNVNSIRARLAILQSWVREHSPDLLALQETKVSDPLFPEAEIARWGYRAYFRGEKAYNGVAVLCKEPPDEVRYGFDDGGPRDEARLQYLRWRDLHVINTYVPQGREISHPMYRYKLEWFSRLREWLERRFSPNEKILWIGDLNVARTPADVYNPEEREQHVCYHHAVREAFERCLGWGFVDVFRKYHPEPGQYTFYDYRAPRAVERGLGWRVDYILATPRLARRSRDAFIDLAPRKKRGASDHTVLVADFACPLTPRARRAAPVRALRSGEEPA